MKRAITWLIPMGALLLCLLAARFHKTVMLAAYLAAWWFWVGIIMGALANVWLHSVTGGQWGEAVRPAALGMARGMWLAALLFLPVLLGMSDLYPWAASAGQGVARWGNALSAPSFKNAWLTPWFFTVRSIGYLLLWCVLAWLTRRPSLQRSPHFAAGALIAYGFSVSLAAVDWIMSLLPLWYSSVFGWLLGTGQMLAGMAAAVLWASWRAGEEKQEQEEPERKQKAGAVAAVMPDLGNLLMMYVMIWAYLAFVQFLIIWAENLPNEIAWYLPRAHGAWLAVAWLLAIFLFAVPLLVLLFRSAKRSPVAMRWLAIDLLLMKLIDCWWLVLPSLPGLSPAWLWTAPLAVVAIGASAYAVLPAAGTLHAYERTDHA